MPICKNCLNKFPNHIKIDNKIRNLCNRKFCLVCSPWNSHNTKDLTKYPKQIGLFRIKRPRKNNTARCLVNQRRRAKERKAELIKLNGGGCLRCGYNKCHKALDFHHKDPSTKSFSLTANNLWGKTWEAILDESKKCILVCANCHREIHDEEYQKI